MQGLTPFEKGMIMALTSIVASLRSTPGFDSAAMEKAAQYFIDNPANGCGSGDAFELYEWPLSILKQDLSQLQNMLNADKTLS